MDRLCAESVYIGRVDVRRRFWMGVNENRLNLAGAIIGGRGRRESWRNLLEKSQRGRVRNDAVDHSMCGRPMSSRLDSGRGPEDRGKGVQ